MIILKQVIHYLDTNSVEATWVDRIQEPDIFIPEVPAVAGVEASPEVTELVDEWGEVIRPYTPAVEAVEAKEAIPAHYIPGPVTETVVKCHSYADVQMDMLREDLVADITDYEELIALVESGIVPPAPEILPPIVVSPWQMRKALNQVGLRATVETAVENSTDQELKDGWEYATEFKEDEPFVLSMCLALGISDEDRHELFNLASVL